MLPAVADAVTPVYVTDRNAGAGQLGQYTPGGGSDELAEIGTGEADDGNAVEPYAAAVSPNGTSLYATSDGAAGELLQFDIASDGSLSEKVEPLSLAGGPATGIAVRPVSGEVYVAYTSGSIRHFDVNTAEELSFVNLADADDGNLEGIAIHPTGNFLYAASRTGGSIFQFEIASNGDLTEFAPGSFEHALPGGGEARFLSLTPDGQCVYASSGNDNVEAFDVGFDGGLVDVETQSLGAGANPAGIAVSPDGTHLYVTLRGSDQIASYLIDPGTCALTADPDLAAVAAGTDPYGIAVSPDNLSLYATAQGDDDVRQYTLDSDGDPAAKPAGPFDTDLADPQLIVAAPDQPPAAVFGVDVNPAGVGETVTFDAGASSDPEGEGIASYEWDFGDGDTATGEEVTHDYDHSDNFPVSLTVTDETGTSLSDVYTGQTLSRRGAFSPALGTDRVHVPDPGPPAPTQGGMVYATISGLDQLMRYSIGSGGLLASQEVESGLDDPQGVAMTPDARSLYVTNRGGDTVSQFRAGVDGSLTPMSPATVETSSEPRGIAVAPDGESVYVANAGTTVLRQYSVQADGRLTPKSPPTVTVRDTLGADAPAQSVAVNPDGQSVYASGAGFIAQFDVAVDGTLSPKSPTASVPGGLGQDMALAPDGDHLYAAGFGSGIDRYPVDAGGALPVTGATAEPASLTGNMAGVAVSPDGDSVYGTYVNGGVAAGRPVFQWDVDAVTGDLDPKSPRDHVFAADFFPVSLAVSRDSRSVWVSDGGGLSQFNADVSGLLSVKSAPTAPGLPNGLGAVVVAPDHPPVASFGASPGGPGRPTTFDAGASTDLEGISRYDWDFGDGSSAANAGPTPSHVYAAPGDYTVRLTTFDDAGSPSTQVFTGKTASRSASGSYETTRTVSVPGDPPPPQQPGQSVQGVQTQSPPPPEFGESVQIERVGGGRVLVRLPGTNRFVPIESLTSIPVGSTVDARAGRARIVVESGDNGPDQEGVFWDGVFRVDQIANARLSQRRRRVQRLDLTDLRLVSGSFRGCPRPARARSRARRSSGDAGDSGRRRRRRKSSSVRKLWGDAKGNWRSSGRHSSATVRGTRWLVQDRCDGTLTQVRSGVVDVRDVRLRRTVTLRRGGRYLARAR